MSLSCTDARFTRCPSGLPRGAGRYPSFEMLPQLLVQFFQRVPRRCPLDDIHDGTPAPGNAEDAGIWVLTAHVRQFLVHPLLALGALLIFIGWLLRPRNPGSRVRSYLGRL